MVVGIHFKNSSRGNIMNTNKIDVSEYELMGGSAKIPEGLKMNVNDIVFNEDNIIITRHMTSYYWWQKKNSANNCVNNYCKANAKIDELKLIDKGYPLSELNAEIALIKECKCLEDVKNLKKHHLDDIKWHDVFWTYYNYDDHGDRVVWETIPIKDGFPSRKPKYLTRNSYYEWGQKYSVVKEIE